MKYFLVLLALLASLMAVTTAAPGMRGNGASGATRDQDPSNPNLPSRYNSYPGGASAAATGNKPFVSTYSENNNGHRYSNAHASSFGGNASASASA